MAWRISGVLLCGVPRRTSEAAELGRDARILAPQARKKRIFGNLQKFTAGVIGYSEGHRVTEVALPAATQKYGADGGQVVRAAFTFSINSSLC
jgi:hypothetical protein